MKPVDERRAKSEDPAETTCKVDVHVHVYTVGGLDWRFGRVRWLSSLDPRSRSSRWG